MRSKTILALVLLNVTLLATLLFPNLFTPTAKAQLARPSDYLMVTGEVPGGNGGIVFILDTRNKWLTAFNFNGHLLEPMPTPIDLNRPGIFK